jgi:hypothetical protein
VTGFLRRQRVRDEPATLDGGRTARSYATACTGTSSVTFLRCWRSRQWTNATKNFWKSNCGDQSRSPARRCDHCNVAGGISHGNDSWRLPRWSHKRADARSFQRCGAHCLSEHRVCAPTPVAWAARGHLRAVRFSSSPRSISGSLAMLAAMRRTSSQILPVLPSFPSLFRLQRRTELNNSSAGGRRGSGGSCHA